MSLVNLIIILLQLCPLGGFELGRFANEGDVQAQTVRGMFGFECALPVFEPSKEYRFTDQCIAVAKDGEKKDFASCHFSSFELFSFPQCINF